MATGRFARHARKLPALDSDRSRASAQLFLTGARSLDHVTAADIASRYNLSPKLAEYMLMIELQRRERQG